MLLRDPCEIVVDVEEIQSRADDGEKRAEMLRQKSEKEYKRRDAVAKEGLTFKSMCPRTDWLRGVSPEVHVGLVDSLHLSVNA